MLLHYLAKLEVRVLAYLEENADENITLIFEHTPDLMHLTYLLTCCFNFRFLLNILCR